MFYFYHDENMMIPYDRPKTLYNASSYLKPGISFEINDKHATGLQQKAQRELLTYKRPCHSPFRLNKIWFEKTCLKMRPGNEGINNSKSS
jgi:hypothetical protein